MKFILIALLALTDQVAGDSLRHRKLQTASYPITSTGQTACTEKAPDSNQASVVDCVGAGQDASFQYLQQDYCDRQDGTVIDMVRVFICLVEFSISATYF